MELGDFLSDTALHQLRHVLVVLLAPYAFRVAVLRSIRR